MAEVATAGGVGGNLVRLPDGDSHLEFAGAQIAHVSQAEPGKPRWVELTLYSVNDGTGRYVLHRVGRSTVYHRDGSRCRRGAPVPARDLPTEAVPCTTCRPPVRDIAIAAGGTIQLESDHYGAAVCDDPRDVINKLRMPGDGGSMIGSQFSAPAQRLLDAARHVDDGIRNELLAVRRLT